MFDCSTGFIYVANEIIAFSLAPTVCIHKKFFYICRRIRKGCHSAEIIPSDLMQVMLP